MEREYEVYRKIGPCPFVPTLRGWDDESRALFLEGHPNGDLEMYVRNRGQLARETRRKWALQAAQALTSLHALDVVHHDVAPRNFLLTAELDLRICDFANSSYPGHIDGTSAPGPRHQSKVWGRTYVPTRADDIFALGSVLYFIMAGEEPYQDLKDKEIEEHFEALRFPAIDQFDQGIIIQGCWAGQLTTAEQVVQALSVEASHE